MSLLPTTAKSNDADAKFHSRASEKGGSLPGRDYIHPGVLAAIIQLIIPPFSIGRVLLSGTTETLEWASWEGASDEVGPESRFDFRRWVPWREIVKYVGKAHKWVIGYKHAVRRNISVESVRNSLELRDVNLNPTCNVSALPPHRARISGCSSAPNVYVVVR